MLVIQVAQLQQARAAVWQYGSGLLPQVASAGASHGGGSAAASARSASAVQAPPATDLKTVLPHVLVHFGWSATQHSAAGGAFNHEARWAIDPGM